LLGLEDLAGKVKNAGKLLALLAALELWEPVSSRLRLIRLRKPPSRLRSREAIMLRHIKQVAVAVGLLLMLGGPLAVTASAADRDCGERVAREQRELDRAIDRHGYNSRQAEHERREIAKLRAKCDAYRDRYGYR